MDADPYAVLAEHDIVVPPGFQIRVVANTKETINVVMPLLLSGSVADEQMAEVAGGSSASTVGSVGSAGSASTVPTTFSSAGTASSVGTAGSAG